MKEEEDSPLLIIRRCINSRIQEIRYKSNESLITATSHSIGNIRAITKTTKTKKTFIGILQETSCQDCIREDLDIVKKMEN